MQKLLNLFRYARVRSLVTEALAGRASYLEEHSRDFARVRSLVAAAVADRTSYVEQHGLDPAVWLPAANWAPGAPNSYLDGYRTLMEDESAVAKLRELSQPFSGYHLVRVKDDPQNNHWIANWRRLTAGLDRRFWLNPPPICGETGPKINGVIVNHDTMTYQERMTLLARSGMLQELTVSSRPRILEIGGGYGALALAITSALPQSRYVICDLPESLVYSGLYLTASGRRVDIGPESGGIALLPNYRFRELSGPVDLVVNTLSMSEMSESQVRAYCQGIVALLADGGRFFEQNQDNTHLGLLDAQHIVASYFRGRTDITHLVGQPMNGTANLWRLTARQ